MQVLCSRIEGLEHVVSADSISLSLFFSLSCVHVVLGAYMCAHFGGSVSLCLPEHVTCGCMCLFALCVLVWILQEEQNWSTSQAQGNDKCQSATKMGARFVT